MSSRTVESNIITNKKFCLIDSTHETYRKQWYKYQNGWICSRCRNKLLNNPKHNPISHPKRIRYKGKHVYLDQNPRDGYCRTCPNNIHDGSCKRTHIHHIQYHDNDPLKDTIEVCVSCHKTLFS